MDQYIDNLSQYKAISMDVGEQDGLQIDAGKLHDILDKFGIVNGFEISHSAYSSAVAYRIRNHVMPFVSQNLCFQTSYL